MILGLSDTEFKLEWILVISSSNYGIFAPMNESRYPCSNEFESWYPVLIYKKVKIMRNYATWTWMGPRESLEETPRVEKANSWGFKKVIPQAWNKLQGQVQE